MEKERFKAKEKGNSGSWGVYDNQRECFVLQSVSPNASYNEEYAKKVVYLMNLLNTHLGEPFSQK